MAGQFEAAVAADAPRCWWKFDEAPGATTFANSGSMGAAGNATVSGSPVLGVPGLSGSGSAMNCNGAGGAFVPASADIYGLTNTLTYEMLLTLPATSTGTQTLCIGHSGTTQHHQFRLTDGKPEFITFSASSYVVVTAPSPLSNSQSHHIVACDAGGSVTLWVNGSQVASGNLGTARNAYQTDHYIGAQTGSAIGPVPACKGTIDNMAIYLTALNSSRVTAHYQAFQADTIGTPQNLISWGTLQI